jgi:ElaB/YqjD/DUF883 family membrane-anchored ribosome-binding protein
MSNSAKQWATGVVDRTEATAGQFADDTRSTVNEFADKATDAAGQAYGQARDAARTVTRSVQQEPLMAILAVGLIAGAVGFLMGRR